MVKILEIKDLNYRDFHNINLSFEHNHFYSIVGGNKSGKTTLFKIIVGFIKPSAYIKCGNFLINDKYNYIKNFGIVTVVDNNSFIFDNVLDEMMFPLKNLGYKDNYIKERIDDTLKLFNLEEIINKKIIDLSIYEKQKLLLSIALLHKPKVLVMDNVLELFSNNEQAFIIQKLKSIDNLCVINFTFSLKNIFYSDKIILMNNYQIIKELNKEDIYNDDKIFYENNIEVPFVVDLNLKLKMYKLIDKNYNNVKDMVNDIWQ